MGIIHSPLPGRIGTNFKPPARPVQMAAVDPLTRDQVAVGFEAVTRRFGETTALDAISFTIPPGQTVALLGPNGAGKSTAINLVLGLLRPSGGSVSTLGRDPRDAIASGRVGAMLQTSGLPVAARVGELVRFVRSLYPEALSCAAIIERAGLSGLERRGLETLSGGEAQRLRFALAIAGHPDLVFLDEPTVGMDVEARRAFWSSMRQFAAEGRTVVFATHYLDEADDVAERIVVLDHGRIVADGPGAAIKANVAGRIVRFSMTGASHDVLAPIEAMAVVKGVEIDGDRVIVTTSDSDAVSQRLFGADFTIRDLEVGGADLEDAFVALTAAGRTRGPSSGQKQEHPE